MWWVFNCTHNHTPTRSTGALIVQLPVCLVLCADDWSVWLAGNVRGQGLCRLWCYWLLISFGFPPSQYDLELLFSAYIDWCPQSPAANQISLQNKATENEQKTTFRPNCPLPSFLSCCIKDLINRLLMLFPECCAHDCLSVVFLFSLQNTQNEYVICGVKLPNSEDFQGKFGVYTRWTFLLFKTDLSINRLIDQNVLSLQSGQKSTVSLTKLFSFSVL